MRPPIRIYPFEPQLLLAGVLFGLTAVAWWPRLGLLVLVPVILRMTYVVTKG